MVEEVEEGGEEDRDGLGPNGEDGFSEGDKDVSPEEAEGPGIPAAARRRISSELPVEVFSGGISVEEVGGFNSLREYGKHPGCFGQSPPLPVRDGPDLAQGEPRMAIGFKRSRVVGEEKGRGIETYSEDCDVSRRSEGHEHGTEQGDKSGGRIGMEHGSKGGLYHSPQDGQCQGGRPGDISKVCAGQDRLVQTVLGAHSPSILGDPGLHRGEEEEGRRGVLALPRSEGRAYQEMPKESGPSAGAEVAEAGCDSALSGGGHEGQGSPSCESTPNNGHLEQVSRVRVADGGEGGEGQEGRGFGTGKRGKGQKDGGGGWSGGERDGDGRGGGGGYVGIPRFVRKNFIDPPSWEELQRIFPRIGEIQRIRFPLNVKRVSKGDIKKLRNLSFINLECKLFLLESLRVLHDEELYKGLAGEETPPPLQKPSLSRVELDSLENYKFEKASEVPLWGTFPFKIAEPQKKRSRAIFDCKINKVIKSTPKYTLKNKRRIREDLSKISSSGNDYIFVQFDFRSFYDQFPLWKRVRKYFGFLGHNGMWYWLTLLPMGFRLAVACAQAAMWAFLDFERDVRVAVATCIDNVCFSGPRKSVYDAINKFLNRVYQCNFTLNNFEEIQFLTLSEEEKLKLFGSLEETCPEFLGEKYNFPMNTRCLNEKTVEKLKLVWKEVGEELGKEEKCISNRQFFSVIGILIYATEILNIQTFSLYNVFKKVREVSKFLADHEDQWDEKIRINFSKKEYNIFKDWVVIVLKNNPVPLAAGKKVIPNLEAFAADYCVVLDASRWGWGALLFGSDKIFKFFANEQWVRGDYGASTKAEPLGVEAAVGKWRGLFAAKKVAIITDHKNLLYANTAMFVHSYYYNRCIEALQRLKEVDGTEFQIYFLRGKVNTADGVSRGSTVVNDKLFPQVEGTGLCTALTLPWQT